MEARNSVRSIVDALGGGAVLAQKMGFRNRSSVSNWMNGGIPLKHWPILVEIAKAKRVKGVTLAALRRVNEPFQVDA